jgi:hypothetical protein
LLIIIELDRKNKFQFIPQGGTLNLTKKIKISYASLIFLSVVLQEIHLHLDIIVAPSFFSLTPGHAPL